MVVTLGGVVMLLSTATVLDTGAGTVFMGLAAFVVGLVGLAGTRRAMAREIAETQGRLSNSITKRFSSELRFGTPIAFGILAAFIALIAVGGGRRRRHGSGRRRP